MCTITYIPTKQGYLFTQNRDESPLRKKAVFPVSETIKNTSLLYPKDPEGSGSWFVSSKEGTTVGIMNGAYHPDKKDGDYRHSRGLVPLHFFDFENTSHFLKNYQFNGLEAFTLVIANNKGVDVIDWTESDCIHEKHEKLPLIFQSKPLYPSPLKEERQVLFNNFTQDSNRNILDFHIQPQSHDTETDILMDRKMVKTVSVIHRDFQENNGFLSYAPVSKKIIFEKVQF